MDVLAAGKVFQGLDSTTASLASTEKKCCSLVAIAEVRFREETPATKYAQSLALLVAEHDAILGSDFYMARQLPIQMGCCGQSCIICVSMC